MYGFDKISKRLQKKPEATEIWYLQKMLPISWTAKKTNKMVL